MTVLLKREKKIAHFLNDHPFIDTVYWPGLKSHSNHEVAKSQMKDFGGMISFNLVGDDLEMAKRVVSKTELFTLAESLGGVESLIGHPSTMTHASIPRKERRFKFWIRSPICGINSCGGKPGFIFLRFNQYTSAFANLES